MRKLVQKTIHTERPGMVAEETYYEWVEDEKDIDIVNEESTIAEENKE